jgi:hypothetical protein
MLSAPPDPQTAADAHWLAPGPDFVRALLGLPQLAVVEESCAAERALHDGLMRAPMRPVAEGELGALADADARANYAMFLAFRDAVAAAGTLEAYYLALMRSGRVAVAPVFVDRVVAAIVDDMLSGSDDAFEHRAGELLHRAQRVTASDGQVLAGDLETLDHLHATAGFGELGRLLREAQAPLRGSSLRVLAVEHAAEALAAPAPRPFLLDLTHEVANDLGHGLSFTMTRTHSGLRALARVLERWVRRFLAVDTTITPLARIDDPAWSWHIGLDVEATALLNALWRGEAPETGRLRRLIGLFRLEFADAGEMRADLAGRSVYLGLATSESGTLKLKPQNLLLDLPLAAAM